GASPRPRRRKPNGALSQIRSARLKTGHLRAGGPLCPRARARMRAAAEGHPMKVLAGDIGGTNTRLAVVQGGRVLTEQRYPSAASAVIPLGGDHAPVPAAPIAVLGAGTGLGVAFLVHNGARYEPVPSEGGHRELAARTEVEMRLWAFLHARHGHVSLERVLSG